MAQQQPFSGKDSRWEEKGTTEDEMVGWYHRLNDMSLSKLRELVMDRKAWHISQWDSKESDTTVQLNWTDSHIKLQSHFLAEWGCTHIPARLRQPSAAWAVQDAENQGAIISMCGDLLESGTLWDGFKPLSAAELPWLEGSEYELPLAPWGVQGQGWL